MLVGRSLGQYHVLEKTGRGGMASVYKAQDLVNDRIVAIKVLAPHLASESNFRDRFRREANVLSHLSHPNIVSILDYGEGDSISYIVMPFMEMRSLRERIQKERLSFEESGEVLEQVSSALQYAHDAGIVHRDIKPSNILIDEKGKVWLSDFGFAHVHDATLSLTGSALIGTPAYMAPEQVKGEPVSPVSDQYSLGIVLFQMVTGCLPFDAETPMATAISHVTEPMPRPRDVNPELPCSLERVLLKALAKNPAHRYASVTELNQAFKDALSLTHEAANAIFSWRGIIQRCVDLWHTLTYRARMLLLKPYLFRRTALIGGVMIMMAFPLAAVALVGNGETPSETELRSTLDVLYTSNAPLAGTPEDRGMVQTAVAGTMSVLDAERQAALTGLQDSPTPNPNGLTTGTLSFTLVTPTPTPTGTSSGFIRGAIPASTNPGSSSLPALSTPTPAPFYTATPYPTSVPPTDSPPATAPPPTATYAPPPTSVPPEEEPEPEKCKGPDHPVFPCTPTPSS